VRRIGLIGAGKVARVHAANLARIEGARLVAVADVLPEAARGLAEEVGCDALESADALLARDDVEAVLVTTPPDTHAELIQAAAAAGKHLFCEKPLATSLADARAAVEAAERAGVLLQIGYNRRFDPSFRTVRDEVKRGDIGRPLLLRISSRDPEPPPAAYLPHSGGVFLDTTSHDLDLARFVLDAELTEVAARGASLVDEHAAAMGDVDTLVVALAFSNGAFGAIDNCRRSAYGYDQRLEVHGTEGLAQAENVPANFYTDRYEDAFRLELESFVRALDGAELEVSGRDGLAAVAAAEAARRSLDEARVVRLEEVA
jgi:myo-inositol 2-dehydrogenase / D-chiro-inositol 1-dehydrogenase